MLALFCWTHLFICSLHLVATYDHLARKISTPHNIPPKSALTFCHVFSIHFLEKATMSRPKASILPKIMATEMNGTTAGNSGKVLVPLVRPDTPNDGHNNHDSLPVAPENGRKEKFGQTASIRRSRVIKEMRSVCLVDDRLQRW